MVRHYEYSRPTINSHHKVLVNLQASNMDAKLERIFNKLRAMRCLNILATKITSGVASIGPRSRPLIRPVGPGQARFGCFHDCCLRENNYFDQLKFTFDCHDYIAVTHNRSCNLQPLKHSFNFKRRCMYIDLHVFSSIIT